MSELEFDPCTRCEPWPVVNEDGSDTGRVLVRDTKRPLLRSVPKAGA